MCTGRVALMWSIIAARVVDLPDPVGPVTSTRPRGRSQRYWHTFGRFNSASVGMASGMQRNTAPMELLWMNTFARNRDNPGIEYAKSSSSSASKRRLCSSESSARIISRVSFGLSGFVRSTGTISPRMRRPGGLPTVRWRSEPPRSSRSRSRSSTVCSGPPGAAVPLAPGTGGTARPAAAAYAPRADGTAQTSSSVSRMEAASDDASIWAAAPASVARTSAASSIEAASMMIRVCARPGSARSFVAST